MEQYDKENLYCKSLGHDVPFSYCRTVVSQLPCRHVMNCWFHKIDIETYMHSNFNEEELETIFKPPQDKVATLVDLIEKAKNRGKE